MSHNSSFSAPRRPRYKSCKPSTFPKIVENQSFEQRSTDDCDSQLSPTHPLEHGINPSIRSRNAAPNCGPRVSPTWPCGLWPRGAVYQYRTRVPADLRKLMGISRINQSLKTASLTMTRRLVGTIAFEIEREFEAVRVAGGSHGLRADISATVARVQPVVSEGHEPVKVGFPSSGFELQDPEGGTIVRFPGPKLAGENIPPEILPGRRHQAEILQPGRRRRTNKKGGQMAALRSWGL